MTQRVPIVLAALLMLTTTTGCTHVEQGHVGIQVDSCGGTAPFSVGPGYHGVGACTTIIEYPVYMQTAVWTANRDEGHPTNEEITFTNADQMQVAADISIAYQLDPERAPAFYAKFRADNLDTFTHGFLRNLAREKFDVAAGKYRIEQIMGDNAGFLKEVRTSLQADLTPYGITIHQFGFVGAPRPPHSVIDAINSKATATQKALQIELELKQAEAEARKHVAQAEGKAQAMKIEADAQAYANQKLASSLSQVLVNYRQIEKWDGKLPQVSGGANTLLNLGSK